MPKDESEHPAAALTLLLREERSALLTRIIHGGDGLRILQAGLAA